MVEEAVEDAKVNAQLNGKCLHQLVVGCITLFYYLTLCIPIKIVLHCSGYPSQWTSLYWSLCTPANG